MPSFHAEKCRRLVSIHEASVRARLCSSIPPVPDLYYTVYLFMKTGRADMQTAKQTLTSNTIQTLLQADKHHCYIIIQSRFHSQSFVQRRKIALFNASALHCSCCPAEHGARWPYCMMIYVRQSCRPIGTLLTSTKHGFKTSTGNK